MSSEDALDNHAGSPRPTGISSGTTRKGPPTPLLIPPSSLSPKSQVPRENASASHSTSPDVRNSIDSSRTDLTSLRINDFPPPPSVLPFLPTIPASPRTPRSLFFSTTPTTPRSQQSVFLHEPSGPSKSLVPSPKSLTGFFTRSNSSLPRLEQERSAPVTSPVHNQDEETTVDVEPYPYHIYTGSRAAERALSPSTTRSETSGGLDGNNSGRSSPLLAPGNQTDPSSRLPSPLRQASFAAQQDEARSFSPSLNPPRSPLPIPPSLHSSMRNSGRISQIMRQVGPIDMDINEEQLLSTDFISEMLRQPGSSATLPERPGAMSDQQSSKSSGKVSYETQRLEGSPIPSSFRGNNPSTIVPDTSSVLLAPDQRIEYPPSAHRVPSVLASSVYPTGGDVIIFNSPLASPAPTSPDPQSRERGHKGRSSVFPATPLTPDSFISTDSPDVPRSVLLQGHSRPNKPSWRASSMSQMIASRLPIGRSSLNVSSATPQSPLISKIRQHRYPKPAIKPESTNSDSSGPFPENPKSGEPPSPVLATSLEAVATNSNKDKAERRETLISAKSQATSTWTNRDSLVPPTLASEYQNSDASNDPRSSYISQDHSLDSHIYDSTADEGEIQVARKVETSTATALDKTNSTSRSVVGVAPAMVIRHKNTPSTSDGQRDNASIPTSNTVTSYELPLPQQQQTDPASPPPLSPKPPSHHTEVPESAKSLTFQDDGTDGKQEYLSRKSLGEAYWSMYPNAVQSESVNREPLQKASPRATSFKSIISYMSSKSKTGSVTTRATRASHSNSSRWAWLMRKPLPPLPPQDQIADDDDHEDEKYDRLANDNDLSYLPVHQQSRLDITASGGDYQKSKISLPLSSGPEMSGHHDNEKGALNSGDARKNPTIRSGGAMFDMLGNDSLKVARHQSRRRQGIEGVSSPGREEISNYGNVSRQLDGGEGGGGPGSFASSLRERFRRKWLWAIMIIVAIILIILIAVLATKLRSKKAGNPNCTNGKVGALCNLDPTCVCPQGSPGTCSAPLAKDLDDLVPLTSKLFTTNITSVSLATVLWETLGTPVNNDCSAQAVLVDVGSVLDEKKFSNRTQWAQSALLWNLYETGDINEIRNLQGSINTMPFETLSQDGPVGDSSGRFSTFSAGYLFDFANQSVTPQLVTFKDDASPSDKQLAELNGMASAALDRMYSFATASSIQRQTALSTFWRAILQLDPNDLPTFLGAFRASPILLPFDATGSPGDESISSLLNNAINKTSSFPIPISCFPGLSDSQLDRINAVEGTAFGLGTIESGATKFVADCFPNRPIYGVLDVLRLRLPFTDNREGVSQQAAVINTDASVRAVLHNGELLAALPGPTNTNISDSGVDPRHFGTLSHVNHIALKWLQSFSDPVIAAEAAKFVLNSTQVPPPSSSSLFNTTIPVVEVAMFGNVLLSDISSFISSFSTPSGSLFFGSSQGQTFRTWALQSSSTIAWANSAWSPEVVHETSSANADFEIVWNASGGLLGRGPTNAASVNLVVNALQGRRLFSP